MSIDYGELENIAVYRDEQAEWWEEHRAELDEAQRDELVEWIDENGKFNYFQIIRKVALSNFGDPEQLGDDLERISNLVDSDLAWGQLIGDFRDKAEARKDLTWEIYQELVNRDDEWVIWISGIALGKQPDDVVSDEALNLLNSDSNDHVAAGIQAVIEKYKEQQVPSKIIDTFHELVEDDDDDEITGKILRACSILFVQNPSLWDLTLDIADDPEYIPFVIDRFSSEITDTHLDEFLELIKRGIESEKTVRVSLASYFLHSRFSHRTDELVEFVIWLSDYNLYEAGRLAGDIAEQNEDFWAELVSRRDEFTHTSFSDQILDESAKYTDEEIQELRRSLDDAFNEPNPNKKGDLLEDAGELLTALIPDFEPQRNIEAKNEEIDIMVHNHNDDYLQIWGTPILLECKNRESKVNSKQVRDFGGKMLNRTVETGFIISRSGFTAGAEEQIRLCRSGQWDIRVGMIPMDELLRLSDNDEVFSLLVDKYDEIYEL